MRARVYIATTEGAALVRRLAPEEGLAEAELSAVCLDGTPTRLPITGAYTYFVRDHVRSLSGGAAYRLDLDRRIDGGSSWMLGVWIAHVLLAEGRLALGDEAADMAVFATGEMAVAPDVERRAEVRPVERVGDKVANLAKRAEEERQAGRRLLLIAPRGNAAEAEHELAQLPEPIRRSASVHVVAGTDDVRRVLACQNSAFRALEGTSDSLRSLPRRRPGRLLAVLLLCLVTAAAGIGYAAWWRVEQGWQALRDGGRYLELARSLDAFPLPVLAQGFREGLRREARTAALVLSVAARRPADGGSCAGLRFRGGRKVSVPVPVSDGVYHLDGLRTLCGLEVRAAGPEGATAGHGWILLNLDAGKRVRTVRLSARRMAAGPLTETPLELSQDLPLYLQDSLAWTVTAVGSRVASEDMAALLRDHGATGTVTDLEALGISVTRARIELQP